MIQQVDEPVRRLAVIALPSGGPGGEVLGEIPGGLGRRLGRSFTRRVAVQQQVASKRDPYPALTGLT
jgi:hypothetical protein